MGRYKTLQGKRLEAGEPTPFLGAVVDLERTEKGVFIHIPVNMLNNAGIPMGMSEVEVWREVSDGTIRFQLAKTCDVCGRGGPLYKLDMGFAKKNICADHYFNLTGQYPGGSEIPEQR